MYLVYYIGSLYIPTVYTACGTHDQLIGLHESNFEVAIICLCTYSLNYILCLQIGLLCS